MGILKKIINEEMAKIRKVINPKTHNVVKKYYCDKGYKLDKSGTKPTCKKEKDSEKRRRSLAARKAALKRARDKAGTAKANKKRAKTLKIRKQKGL